MLVLNEVLEREEVVEYFKYLLDAGLKDRTIEVITSIVCYGSDLHPRECYESIKRCFDNKEVSTFTIDLKSVQRDLKQEKGIIISRSKRNDPCPCGSGKKYKKCCGK